MTRGLQAHKDLRMEVIRRAPSAQWHAYLNQSRWRGRYAQTQEEPRAPCDASRTLLLLCSPSGYGRQLQGVEYGTVTVTSQE